MNKWKSEELAWLVRRARDSGSQGLDFKCHAGHRPSSKTTTRVKKQYFSWALSNPKARSQKSGRKLF